MLGKTSKPTFAAQALFGAAVDGDPVGCDILAGDGRYLGAMAVAVARRLNTINLAFDVVQSGGVFDGAGSVLVDAMKSAVLGVCLKAELVAPEFAPVVGTLLKGLELERVPSAKTYRVLREQLAPVERRHRVKLMAGES